MATPPAPRLFEPIRVGRLTLKNRIIAPPHAANLGALFGTEPEADRYVSYWRSLAEGGTGLLTALNGFVENILPPGFDPTGVGARKAGVFRNPLFVERMGRIAEAGHANGAAVSTQLIMQGGMPHGPSPRLSGPVINNMPHTLTRREIRAFVAEYRLSAEQALRAGLDAIELHANHDDLIEWFLSPLTNHRSDAYEQILEGGVKLAGKIAVIAQDDHIAPLSLASHIANGGADVAIFIQTNGPAPQLSRYIVGGVLGRLSEQGVKFVCMEAVSRIAPPVLHTRNVYSQRPAEYTGFDAVVLACGGVADASMYEQICEDMPNVHVLGDAYAPRRVVFATQQGHELGKVI